MEREMHTSAQPNGRSPRNTSGIMLASQLKPSADSLQNTASLPSQSKGRKRDRPDQSIDPVKREHCSKMGDVDPGRSDSESVLKLEIAEILQKGPLVDIEGVDGLVHVMSFEIKEKKKDLSARTMLTNIIVETEKPDCLSRFVQIRGLAVLDDWLQDVHKGKTGALKHNDKAAEEFLLVLLRALDKLPVNLPALQMCNIGKSVNHLRSHKNLEIQKKARSLVDMWKRRVEAEMNINDAKMGSNQAGAGSARSRVPEVSHVSRNTGGTSEYTPKSPSVQLSTSKNAPQKLLQGETASKSASQFQGSMKLASPQASAGVTSKDGPPQIGSSSSDVPLTTSRDEKSCSSSPSNNSSLSCSGDHVKNVGSAVKEDTRSSGSASNKMPSSASRHRRSVNGLPVSVASARETASSRTASLHKNVIPDKASQSGITSEKAADVASEVNSHKFIVKIPNRSHSPAQRAVGGSTDESYAVNSRPSSPAHLERHDQLDAGIEDRADASQANASLDANAESWQGNDFRDTFNPNECDGPVDTGRSKEHLSVDGNTKNMPVVSRSSLSSPRNTLKIAKVPEASVDPMNALIESCIIKEEANAPVPIGDDVGMHLLASVAAGEMLKSELASPADSPHGKPSVAEPSSGVNCPEMKPLPLDSHSRDDDMSKDVGSDCTQKDHLEGCAIISSRGGGKTSCFCSIEPPAEEEDRHLSSSSMDMDQPGAFSPESNKVTGKLETDASDVEMNIYSEDGGQSKGRAMLEMPRLDGMQDTKINLDSSISPVNVVGDGLTGIKSEMESGVGTIYGREGKKTDSGPDRCGQLEAKPSGKSLSAETDEKETTTDDGLKAAGISEMDAVNKNNQNEEPDTSMIVEVQAVAGPGSGIKGQVEREVVSEKKISEPVSKLQSNLPSQDLDVKEKSRGCEVPDIKEANEMEVCNSSGARCSVAEALRRDLKLEFDLNEGLNTDDNKFGEIVNFNTIISSAVTLPLVSPLPTSTPFSSASLAAPIAVTAAAAKGPFVPPDDLLRAKVEIGWKGSAATSAFRPAEPRKISEMPINTANVTHSPDISLGKHSRPALDFDLNIADERIVDDAAPQRSPLETVSLDNVRSNIEKAYHEMTVPAPGRRSGGLGLDLNCVDEASTDCANCSISNVRKVDIGVCRDFDLNDEPVVDASEPSTSGQQQLRSSILTHQPPPSGLRVNGAEMGNFSTSFHAGSSYSALPVPSILSDRGEQSFPVVAGVGPPRMMGPSAGFQFNPESYRGPLLSSSPAVPFPSAPFQFSIFPYSTSFPLPSTTLSGSPATYIDPSSGGRLGFPPVHSQLIGPAGSVTSHFSRPYMVSLSDGSGNGNFVSTKKWNRQGLDLNMGPGGPELEFRDEASTLGPKQLSIGGPKSLTEEQVGMYQVSNGLLKRKEPEGGRDGYRHPSWQQ